MSDDDVTVDGAPAQSMHGGPLGDISKLIQKKAAAAVAVEPGAERAPAKREPTTLERAMKSATDQASNERGAADDRGDDAGATPTAAELEAAAAEAADARGEKEGEDDAPVTENADAPAPGKLSIADLAKRLGVDARRLYEDLEIPLTHGRGTVTLAELKDVHRTVEEIEDQRDALSVDRQAFDVDNRQVREQIETAAHALARVVGDERVEPLLAMVRDEQSKDIAAGRKVILERFPEWRDPAKYDEARSAMAEHLAPWGFTRAELEAEMNPRRILYVHANMERDRRAAAAKAKLAAAAPGTRQRSPSARTPAAAVGVRRATATKKRARETGRPEDKNLAIQAAIARGQR